MKDSEDGTGAVVRPLPDMRHEIDEIDDAITSLFTRRLGIVERIAATKRASGVPVVDSAREQEILNRVAAQVPPEYEEGARRLFGTLFEISRECQRTVLQGKGGDESNG